MSHKIQFMTLIEMKREGISKFIGKTMRKLWLHQKARRKVWYYHYTSEMKYCVTSTQLSYCFGSFVFLSPRSEDFFSLVFFICLLILGTFVFLSYHFPSTARKTKASQTDTNSFFLLSVRYMPPLVTVFSLICILFLSHFSSLTFFPHHSLML